MYFPRNPERNHSRAEILEPRDKAPGHEELLEKVLYRASGGGPRVVSGVVSRVVSRGRKLEIRCFVVPDQYRSISLSPY